MSSAAAHPRVSLSNACAHTTHVRPVGVTCVHARVSRYHVCTRMRHDRVSARARADITRAHTHVLLSRVHALGGTLGEADHVGGGDDEAEDSDRDDARGML
eukprot:1684677-Rhodomonas_salina.1